MEKQPQPTLPYTLIEFNIGNYLDIQETAITHLSPDMQWIFITGENGYGKSVVLQALAIGLLGEKDEDTILLENAKKASITVTYRDKGKTRMYGVGRKIKIQQIDDSSLSRHPFKYLVCYGPSRLQIQSSQTENEISRKSTTAYGLFNPDGVLLNIELEMLLWSYEDEAKFKKVKEIFLQLLPQLNDIQVDKDKRQILYIEKASEENSGAAYTPIPFNKLASGYKSVLAMVGDMMIRLFKTQPKITNPSELAGIAIIDELDLHLHPKWQKQLPSLLSQVFPKIQFIATTHSPIPLLGAPEHSIFCKVTRTKEKGICIEKLDIDIKNLLPNILLTSSLFDMDSIIPVTNQHIEEIRTEDSKEEMDNRDAIQKRLDAFEKSENTFPDHLFDKAS